MQRILLGIGTGRCGAASLAKLLDAQAGFSVTHEEWPVLPWRVQGEAGKVMRARLTRLRRERSGAAVLGDVASFYLPYLPAALEQEPGLLAVCLERPKDEVVASFEAWCDRVFPQPVDSWTRSPRSG